VFFQSAGGHLNGYKCKKCSGNDTPTTSEFIEKANLIHNGYYTYDKVEYKSAHSPVIITCKLHGDFQQTPNSHLKGSECSLCSLLKKKNPTNLPKSKSLTEEFIKQGQLKHGYKKYDYSKAIYLNNKTKVTIGCKLHGWTHQFPNGHLKGVGCAKCANEETAKQNRKDITYFLEKAKEVHGKKYSYKQTTFVRMRNLTTIICKKHGEFQQAAYAHLRGQGCPKCKESQGERIIRVFLETHKLKYVYQKKFEDCKNQSYLFFDFYLPKQNLLIEYDGEQHFKTTRGNTFGGEVGFEKRKINDAIKTTYAKTKNIKLLRINFRQLKDIEQILTQELYDTKQTEKHYR
jgi:very-short-patch-repair endonuclease